MRKLIIMLVMGVMALTSCGLPSGPQENPKFPVVTAPVAEVDSIPTIEVNDDFVEDTTNIVVTNTYFSIKNPYFSSETHEDVKRLVIEWKEGEVSFCKLNNTILYSNADKKVSHEYKYLSSNTIQIQEGNTLDGIAADHNTTAEKLRVLNPGLGKVLVIGKTLKVK